VGTIENPYWDALKDLVESDTMRGNPVVGEFRTDRSVAESMARFPNRQQLVRKYCWTIPDPDTVTFVAENARGGLVDPIAGTGYWAYLLAQLGLDVVSYDLNPGKELHNNGWHGTDLYAEVAEMDCAQAAALHPDRTLFLSWPPHGSDVGTRTLLGYQGTRVIYIGEPKGGGTGDDEMHRLLGSEWTEVGSRQPVVWWGAKDHVTVYERAVE
jgi:hypothetical protein